MKTKTLIIALIAVFTLATVNPVIGQSSKEAKKALKARSDKSARKEAKRLAKEEGWSNFPGGLPMEKMLEKSYLRQYEVNEDDEAIWIMAVGNGVGGSVTAAKLAALETAKNELAGLVETRMASLISTSIGNMQLSTTTAESETKVVANAKNMVSMKLQNVEPVVMIKRDRGSMAKAKNVKKLDRLEQGTIEIQITLFYNKGTMAKMAKQAIKETLKEDLKNNEEDLKKLMDL
ncbi:MAG: hypothetical protein KAI79_07675 [Bacteroidales bacterium]|nr:hypothetical protein [Bacteroidales bacterium]